MFWLDIENTGWSNTVSTNQNFFTGLLNEAVALNLTVGIYTSQSQWTAIMGSTFSAGKDYPLWYPHYQLPPQENFDDFVSFGNLPFS